MKKTTGSAEIYLLNKDEKTIAQITSGVTIKDTDLVEGTVTQNLVTPTISEVQQTTQYAVQFKPAHTLPPNSKIVVTFPASVTPDSTCTLSNFVGLDSSLICNYDSVGRKYTLTNPFGSGTYVPASNLLLKFTTGTGTNPLVSGDAGNFQFRTFVVEGGTDYAVDKFDGPGVLTITPGTLKPILKVTPGDFLAYNSPLVYTFEFKTKNVVPRGGTIIIELPVSVSVNVVNLSLAQNECINISGLQNANL